MLVLTSGFTIYRTLVFESTPSGATVLIDGKVQRDPTPFTLPKFPFRSESPEVKIEVRKPPGYSSVIRTVTYQDAKAATSSPSRPWVLSFSLDEIQREIPIEVRADVEDAAVLIDSHVIGRTPLQKTLVFKRGDGSASWPVLMLKVEKEGYEIRTPGGSPTSAFTRTVTVDEPPGTVIAANGFLKTLFVPTPLLSFETTGDRIGVLKTNALSQKDPMREDQPPACTETPAAESLVLSRISPIPGSPDHFIISVPLYEQRQSAAANTSAREIVGANLVMINSVNKLPTTLTSGRQFDIDPFVKGEWIYFASDRDGIPNIWRMPLSGKQQAQRVTGWTRTIDSEPAVSPDEAKLAYTARKPGAPFSDSYIYVSELNGTLPTPMAPGRSPAWSPDGQRIAYVNPKNKIVIMDAKGGNQTPLNRGESNDLWPVWSPGGRFILCSSDERINSRGERNYDIRIFPVDGGNPIPLTTDGSFDSLPALSSDRKSVFFFSNRGATTAGEERLEVYRALLSLNE